MGDPNVGTADITPAVPADTEPEELDGAAIRLLLRAQDPASMDELAQWIKAHAKTWGPLVAEAAHEDEALSAEASCVVLSTLAKRSPADEETTLGLMEVCLVIIADRITESRMLSTAKRGRGTRAIREPDDSLVGAAVGIVTANRRSKLSERAISCLADSGMGGALVLARAFDAVRTTSKVYIVRRLKPAEVLGLGDNVVASLAASVAKLAEELEGKELKAANRFLEELGSVSPLESSEIDPTETLEVGCHVFHATWGAGTVIVSDTESVTVDFGSAGERTLLRAYAKLRHAG